MKAIRADESGSILISADGLNVWVDVYEEGDELVADWNKYIFQLDDESDVKIKAFQEDCNNFDEAVSLAIDFYRLNIKSD